MLKNRDTPSNPYRVPPQPTPMWIKVCISCLLVCVLALMGAVIFLMMVPQCTPVCEFAATGQEKAAPSRDGSRRDVAMADQGEKQLAKPNGDIQTLSENVKKLTATVVGLQSRVGNLESSYRKLISNRDRVDISSGRSAGVALSPSEVATLRKIPQLQSLTRNLDAKLTRHISGDRQADSLPAKYPELCKEGHYRFGVHCYMVGDAKLDQRAAKKWCRDDLGDQASLAIIKDRLTQNFISSKLASRVSTYWIGIQRQSAAPSTYANFPTSTSSSIAPSAVRSGQFEYSDGTRVQRNVWQMWRPDNPAEGGSAAGKNCAQLSFDRMTAQWRWEEKLCSDRTGYICQYYIMTS